MMQSHPQGSDRGVTICGTADLSGTQEKGGLQASPRVFPQACCKLCPGKGGILVLRPTEKHRQLLQTSLTPDHILPFDPAVSTSAADTPVGTGNDNSVRLASSWKITWGLGQKARPGSKAFLLVLMSFDPEYRVARNDLISGPLRTESCTPVS